MRQGGDGLGGVQQWAQHLQEWRLEGRAVLRAVGICPTLGSTTEAQGTRDGGCSGIPGSAGGPSKGEQSRRWVAMGLGPHPTAGGLSCGGKEELVQAAERKGVLTRPLLSNGLPGKEKEECQQGEGTVGVLAE